MANDTNRPEQPRYEPEIIPPDRDGFSSDWRNPPWRQGPFGQGQGHQRVFVGRVGPLGVALLLLAITALMAIFTVTVIGAVLIWMPVLAVLVFAAALYRFLRR